MASICLVEGIVRQPLSSNGCHARYMGLGCRQFNPGVGQGLVRRAESMGEEVSASGAVLSCAA